MVTDTAAFSGGDADPNARIRLRLVLVCTIATTGRDTVGWGYDREDGRPIATRSRNPLGRDPRVDSNGRSP